jgi:hypothetical protein
MARKGLETAADVIDSLGGTQAVADLFGVGYGCVWNWRVRGLPSDTYAVMRRKLKRKRVSDKLWAQREEAA